MPLPTVADLLEQTQREIKDLDAKHTQLLRQRVSRFDDAVLDLERRIEELYRLQDDGIPFADLLMGELGSSWDLTGYFDLTDDGDTVGVSHTQTNLEFHVCKIYDAWTGDEGFTAKLVDNGRNQPFQTVEQVVVFLRLTVEDLHPAQTRLWT